MNVTVTPQGDIRFVWDDALHAVTTLGPWTRRRASHVEDDGHGCFTADMSPMGGPVLGPFHLHKDAIAAEVAWLGKEGY